MLVYPVINAAETTGPELWDKVIAYHDPGGNWKNFSGKVYLITTNWKDRLVGEVITLDRAKDFYQTEKENETESIVGIRNGKPFAELKKPPSENEKKQEQLDQWFENAPGMRQHHSGHIGFPMQAKAAGMTAQNAVELVEFRGKICYALVLKGNSNKVTHPYWEGTVTLYVDPQSYAMRGARREPLDYEAHYFECVGEFELDGIKVQRAKTCFGVEDDSHWWSDVYAPVR